MAAMAQHVEAMLALQKKGAITFDYGNNIRTQAKKAGVENAFDIPGFRSGIHPAAVLRREGAIPLGRVEWRSRRHRAHRSNSRSRFFPKNKTSPAG